MACVATASSPREHDSAEYFGVRTGAYPWLAQQLRAHTNLPGDLTAFCNKADPGEAVDHVALLEFANRWLIDHVVGLDCEFVRFVEERGVH